MTTTGRTVTAAVLVAAALTSVGCSKDAVVRCGDRPIPRNAVPNLDGFRLVRNTEQEPEGCGAGYRRLVVYERTVQDREDILDALSTAITADGWRQTECVTTVERCFQTGKYFIAVTTPEAHDPDLLGYPEAPPGRTDVAIAVLSPDE